MGYSPHNRNVLTPFFYFAFALGKAIFLAKKCKIDRNVQIQANLQKCAWNWFFLQGRQAFCEKNETTQICRHKSVDKLRSPHAEVNLYYDYLV